MSGSRRVVVVGGGVIGVACAHYLSAAGLDVTVIDRGRIGGGCSHGNCGLICPSHVLPLAEPGAVKAGLLSMLSPRAPLRVKPRLDPALWSWLWSFARRCNRRDMLAAGRSIQPLLDSSRALFDELMAGGEVTCEWEERGLLYVFQSEAALQAYEQTDRLLREEFGVLARRFDGNEIISFEPALREGLAGGFLYEHDAHLRPDRLLASWRAILESRGVRFREGCSITGFAGSDGRAERIQTAGEDFSAGAFVVATGAWTPKLADNLGGRIPIQPGKGYSITMQRPEACPNVPLIFPQHRVAVTPMQSGFRLGSIMEFAGYDESLPPQRLALLTEGAHAYLRGAESKAIEETWYGWRPMTYDGLPIIGPSPKWWNVYLAAGHNMLGLSMAPATGKLIAELVTGRPPHLPPEPYAMGRF